MGRDSTAGLTTYTVLKGDGGLNVCQEIRKMEEVPYSAGVMPSLFSQVC